MAILNFKAKYGVQVADSINQAGYDLFPVGSMMYWTGPTSSVPSGWLLCDGSAVSRTTYSNLDAVLATATPAYPYGNGNGSTTFNLPDCQGRALEQEGFTPTNSAKQLTGSETYTLLDSNIVSHDHTLNTHSHAGLNSHTHTGTSHTHSTGSHTHGGSHDHSVSPNGTHSHAIFQVNTSSTGSGVLRASTAQVTPVNTITTANFPHSHTSVGGSGATNSSGYGTLFGLFVNTSTLTSADTGSSTGPSSSANTGANGSTPRASFSLMQPYVVLHVIIKV